MIGEYTATIRSEICVPDDYNYSSCTIIFDEYQISIYIEPCLVSTYTDTTRVAQIYYRIGEPDLTDGYYIFDEDPVCNYPETVTVTNSPTFLIHNEPQSDFTIRQNNDQSLVGVYKVTLKSEICVPDDYS